MYEVHYGGRKLKLKELAELLSKKGLTPEQVSKILEMYERQKERAKEYQRKKYYKISVAVPKEKARKISEELRVSEEHVKNYLACQKLFSSIPDNVWKILKESFSSNSSS